VPGSLLTGLVLGYRIIYDDIDLKDLIRDLIRDLASTDDYILIKRGRRVNLKAVAIAKDLIINDHNSI
jgi:hypothetical protein